ncbi:hypothetical protein RQP53_16820 [Paucibacter sp. APW11]|uniref:YscD/Y4YQ C-terminal domain-containing protein n=1 Tax=Roseateles aquae TaxID=3077235 RepID=A0ABU3PF76_9BURK|nr:hypothetical protein [Paucibacter sp. APW11]MDT9000942.1 hypothetical protein [Paucibacter sp. APW11]
MSSALSPIEMQELRVLAGAQAGARAPLLPGQACLVCGLAADAFAETQFADVLLHSLAPFQLRLLPAGQGRFQLQLLEGQAWLGEQALQPGETPWPWLPGQLLQLGDTVLAYGPAAQAHWPEPVLLDEPARPALAAPRPHRSATRPATQAVERLLALGGLCLLATATAMGLQTSTASQPNLALAAPKPSPAPAPDLLPRLLELYRLHGVAAEGKQLPDGTLQLQTTEVDATRLQAAEAAARREIPGLPAWQLLRQTPPAAAAPVPREDPAKRLVAVVDSADNPFFITADGSRYFTGALLPSGHRVVQIAERSVWVERDGQRLRLTL